MRCGCESAEDCAVTQWSPALDGRRENAGWRARCPVCHSSRALEYDAPAGAAAVRWNAFCTCERDTVRKALAGALGDHLGTSRRTRPTAITAADLEDLALSGMRETALKASLLIRAGHTFAEAMDLLGIDRTTRYRVRRQISHPSRPPARRDESST